MPVLSDEDVGLSPSYLSDEDVGLVEGEMEGAGGETWSPEEQARLEIEQAELAPRTGFKAGMQRFRAGPTGRALFGPTDVEREAGAMSTGSPGEIAGAAMKFATVPPQLADPIRTYTDPAIEMLPPALGGVATGLREVALTIPGPSFAAAPRLAMAAFTAQTVADLPEAKRAYNDALERGDTKAAAEIATQTVANTALLGLGGASEARRFRPPERGGIPEPVRPTTGEPNAAPSPDLVRQQQLDATATPTGPKAVLPDGAKTEAQTTTTQAEVKATAPVTDKSKWTKATDTENLKAATPEQRVAAAQKPLDVDSFLKEDAEGYRAVDEGKLRSAVEGGHITSGDAASDALLVHMLQPSDLHPISSIRMLDFTPAEAQMLSGTSAPFHGRFRRKSGETHAMVEMTMKMQNGEPVTQAQFMETLTHEIVHNNITSKIRDATPEMQTDVDNIFKFVQERGKGTEFEKHNALTSVDELFAEISDPKVHKWLSELDYSGDIRKAQVGIAEVPAITPPTIRNSALGRFLEIAKKLLKLPDFITDAFGNKVETITALDQIVSLSSRLERVQRGGGDTQMSFSKSKPREEFSKAIKDAEKIPNEELIKAKGGPTGAMWDLGAKAKDAGDVAALKAMAEESNAKISALAKEGKIEEAMALAGRQPAEAYEFATGVKLDGTPKWEMFEKRRPGYVPAVPDAKYVAAKGGAAKVEAVAATVGEPPAVLGAGAATTPPASSAPEPLKVTAPQQPSSPASSKTEPSQKWTGATEESAKPETGIGGQMLAGIPNPAAVVAGIKQAVADFGPGVKAAGRVVSDAVRDIYKENLNIRKMDDLSRSVLNWSGKLQRSFGEASSAQKDIQTVVKDRVRDDALSNWLEAGGDKAKLTQWRDGTTDPKAKAGYEAALNLSPDEVAVAQDARKAYDQLFDRAERWGLVDKDPSKPSSFRDDYVTHLWNLGKGSFAGGARTLKDQFRFAKARTFANYFEGEQAGMKPKTKRLSQLLPVYLHEMNSVIAARQLVKQISEGKASDGEPLIQMLGTGAPVEAKKYAVMAPGRNAAVRVYDTMAEAQANVKPGQTIQQRTLLSTIVMPKTPKEKSTVKYEVLKNQPALHDWIFVSTDSAGNPITMKADIALHPEAYEKLKAILGKSKIREWYDKPGTATMAIPKVIAKGLDIFQSETKRTMLGAISPFHQVQEGTHAIGHRVNPFWNVPKPNMENPKHLDAAKHGLMILPDRASERNFTEGLRPSGLVSFIPGIGRLADHYSNYLFHEYIPGLKIKTYDAILERNNKVYEKQLASGEVKPEDVKLLSSTQTNAAYGHLNYADLGRDPTIQHILQLGLLAPDFLEARGRFTGQGLKGLTGAKVGREQLLALATLAVAQAALSWTMAQLTDGEWEAKHPFEFKKDNRRYTLRSVPEDLVRLVTDSRAFLYNRINPITAKVPWQMATGRDWRGQKITVGDTLKEAAKAPIPLTARGFMGVDKSPLKDWEQLAGAVGLKIMRYSPQNEVGKMFQDWKSKSENPRLVAQAEQDEAQTFAPSVYSDLRQALEKEDSEAGTAAYEKLLETRKPAQIKRAMNPVSIDPTTGASRDRMLPKKLEREFLGSLSDEDREVYEDAKRQRKLMYQRFQRLLKGD